MSIERIIRGSQRVQHLIDSTVNASNISGMFRVIQTTKFSKEIGDIIPATNAFHSTAEVMRRAGLQTFSSANSLNRIEKITGVMHTVSTRPSTELTQFFKQISTALPFAQLNFLSQESQSTSNFTALLNQLSLDAHLIEECDVEPEDGKVELSENIESPELIYQRLETLGFLPVRVLDEIAQKPTLMRGLKPHEFEQLTAELLNSLGFENILLTPHSHDGGRDVLATKFVSGIPILFSFECKQKKSKIGIEIMRTFLGSVAHISRFCCAHFNKSK